MDRILKKAPYILTAAHVILSFVYDRFTFEAERAGFLYPYIPCKVLMAVLLFLFWRFVFSIPRRKIRYYIGYLIPILIVAAFYVHRGIPNNDELSMYNEALQLHDFKWFHYINNWYYIISLMILPAWFGPIAVKIGIQVLTCGYCVSRVTDRVRSRAALLAFIPFFLPPLLGYVWSAHRIPIYIFPFLLFFFIPMMDHLDNKSPSSAKTFGLLVLMALLTHWRTEGIYLAVLGPILLFMAYPALHSSCRKVLCICGLSLLIQAVVFIPQPDIGRGSVADQADQRMEPFYDYLITGMIQSGLDLDKNAEDIADLRGFYDLDGISSVVSEQGDTIYRDAIIAYPENKSVCFVEGRGSESYDRAIKAIQRIILHDPVVFIKSRLRSFHYAACKLYPLDLSKLSKGPKGVLSFAIQLMKNLSENQYIPLCLIIFLFIWAIVKRRRITALIMLCQLAHLSIVFILAPAAFFMYYFPTYLVGYTWAVLFLIDRIDHGESALITQSSNNGRGL